MLKIWGRMSSINVQKVVICANELGLVYERVDAGGKFGIVDTPAYKRLNQLAMQLLERDGILVSCSCSYHLSADSLIAAIQRAARHLDRFAQIIEIGGQAPDHPIHPAIPETKYLKSVFVRVVGE